jgi:hypothetical protein
MCRFDAGGFFNGSDASKSIRRHMVQAKNCMEQAEQPERSAGAPAQSMMPLDDRRLTSLAPGAKISL